MAQEKAEKEAVSASSAHKTELEKMEKQLSDQKTMFKALQGKSKTQEAKIEQLCEELKTASADSGAPMGSA